MGRAVDTLGKTVAEGGVLITLRADLPGGVSLGGNQSIEPGETRRVDAALAMHLIASGRAVRAVAAAPEVPADTAPASSSRKRK